MAENHVLIDDILKNQSERMMNLKKFYPFFALYETSFSQYKEGKYQSLDMGYLTLSLLRFFINENNFNENDVTYEMVEKFLRQVLRRDFGLEESETEEAELIRYIFDKIRNDGRPFTFSFFDPEPTEECAAKLRSLVAYALEKGLIRNEVDVDAVLDRTYYDAAAAEMNGR